MGKGVGTRPTEGRVAIKRTQNSLSSKLCPQRLSLLKKFLEEKSDKVQDLIELRRTRRKWKI